MACVTVIGTIYPSLLKACSVNKNITGHVPQTYNFQGATIKVNGWKSTRKRQSISPKPKVLRGKKLGLGINGQICLVQININSSLLTRFSMSPSAITNKAVQTSSRNIKCIQTNKKRQFGPKEVFLWHFQEMLITPAVINTH